MWCRATPATVLGSAWHGPSSVAISCPFLRQRLNLGLQHEDAIEMYYNIAVTHWLNVTADLQIVNPGLKKAINETGQLAHVDTAAVAGARLRVRF